jgi:hypothetical protein
MTVNRVVFDLNVKWIGSSKFSRKGEICRFGVPFGLGRVYASGCHGFVSNSNGQCLPASITPLAHWKDGSVRWLLLEFVLDQNWTISSEIMQFYSQAIGSSLKLNSDGSEFRVDTGSMEFRISRFAPIWQTVQSLSHQVPFDSVGHEILLTDTGGQACEAVFDGEWTISEQNDFRISLKAEGFWNNRDGDLLARFEHQLHFFVNCDTLIVETRVHNPRRAAHVGGLWDLGDPGSICFKALEIRVNNPSGHTGWLQPEVGLDRQFVPDTRELKLYQDSTGGEQWNSRNHIDPDRKPTVGFPGYRICSGSKLVLCGKRAMPIAGLPGRYGDVQASMKHFWQNFPSSLAVEGNKLTIGLFPRELERPYELQGGERKTLTAYFHYGNDPDALLWTQDPLVPVIEARHYEQAKAFPWFRADREPSALDALIQQGMDGSRNFFAKREKIDEYGWRNFGDVFADHETHYQNSGEAPLISHYNNQYDAILGFARQFALTGDRRWFELMDDLARHVTDIDIYHTLEDRVEYNGGLFWHTDHYLNAHTSTHRTFTRHNDTSSTPGQTGGGPASEHCYTTGLLYHYYITGAEASRDAVLQLAHWMTAAHEGQGGLLEQLLALKKNELPQLKALARGERPLAHRYPFTRGTGNYLNTLLDAWLIQPEGRWLQQAEAVIRDTIHPEDNIDERDLLNVETGWSYLILLASIARYTALKEEWGERDASYWYARRSFLRYAEWMRLNERPFLADTAQLEFANDTWVAQDVRKAMLMFQVANLGISAAAAYYEKGSEWLEYVCDRLQVSDEAEYARILIILLQNYGPHHLELAFEEEDGNNLELEPGSLTPHKPYLTWNTVMARVAQRLFRGVRTFRPSREKAWINARMNKV